MQMNGIHVTPVIKGSCLFAKHWNAIWQFCWRQQAQKNNHHLPQKSKSLGQEGEECRVSWCVCVHFRLVLLKTHGSAVSPEPKFCTSSAGKRTPHPCLYFILLSSPAFPGTPDSETSDAEHQRTSTTSSLLFCLVTGRLLKVYAWGTNLSVQATGKDTKLPALLCRVKKICHSVGCFHYISCTLIWNTVKEILY